jgi:hypothetical protein
MREGADYWGAPVMTQPLPPGIGKTFLATALQRFLNIAA